MDDDRLRTDLWLDAHFRRFTLEGLFYTVAHRGALTSGMVAVKIFVQGQGCKILQQQRDLDGVLGWMTLMKGQIVPESEADDFIRRAVSRDPDLWVVEVEKRDFENPFEGKVF
jgi:hypothetical protein